MKQDILKKIALIKNRGDEFGYLTKHNDITYFNSIDGKKTSNVRMKGLRKLPIYGEFCRVSKYICLGEKSGCAIGKPSQKCIDNKTYNKNQCGLVSPEKINFDKFNILVSLSDLEKLVKDNAHSRTL